jgi:hypothetical protein
MKRGTLARSLRCAAALSSSSTLRALMTGTLLFAAGLIIPSGAYAQCGTAPQTSDCIAPSGSIFDLGTTAIGGTVLNTLQNFTTSFIGDGNTEYVSFAFRETPAYFLFDNASVTTGGGPNLLSDTDFAAAIYGQNCNHNNSLGCPPGWGAWIQSVDTAAIGQVATTSSGYGCSDITSAAPTSHFWCDGSVQGYDGIYQAVATTLGATYTVNWALDDNSHSPITDSTLANLGNQIDMLVYAGDNIPVGTTSIGPPPPPGGVPEPGTLSLIGVGVLALGLIRRRRKA